MHECLHDLVEPAQSQLFETVLHGYHLFEEEEELTVSLGLEIFEAAADESDEGGSELLVGVGEEGEEVEELVHLELILYLL